MFSFPTCENQFVVAEPVTAVLKILFLAELRVQLKRSKCHVGYTPSPTCSSTLLDIIYKDKPDFKRDLQPDGL